MQRCRGTLGRNDRTGTEMRTEMMVEWRTDRRNLSVLVKKITDKICVICATHERPSIKLVELSINNHHIVDLIHVI